MQLWPNTAELSKILEMQQMLGMVSLCSRGEPGEAVLEASHKVWVWSRWQRLDLFL